MHPIGSGSGTGGRGVFVTAAPGGVHGPLLRGGSDGATGDSNGV